MKSNENRSSIMFDNNEICEELQQFIVDDTDDTQDVVYVPKKEVLNLNKWLGIIEKATKEDFSKGFYKPLKLMDISVIDSAELVAAIQKRYLSVFERKLPKADAKLLIKPQKPAATDSNFSWCDSWVWIMDQSKFMHQSKLDLVTKDSFNAFNGRYVPDEGQSKPSATKYVFDNGLVENVDAMAYLPHKEDRIVKDGNKTLINTYDHNGELKPAEKYTAEGAAGLKRIEAHIDLLFGNQEKADLFIQWVAWQVQRRGQKIRWAPLIQSPEGMGKSFFGVLLEAILGKANVGTVSSEQVNNPNYNGWVSGRCVNILQELRVQGRNRYEVLNALKAPITDVTIPVTEKYVKSHTIPNVTNYIAFTNYKDAIPLNEHDRRWWVVHVDFADKTEFKKAINNDPDYFKNLFDVLDNHPLEVLKYFHDVTITDEFESYLEAPMSEDKDMMVFNEKANIEGYTESQEILEQGGRFYNHECLCQAEFFNALFGYFEYLPQNEFNNLKKNSLLKALGYQKHPQMLKVSGVSHRVWVKKKMDNNAIRESLGL